MSDVAFTAAVEHPAEHEEEALWFAFRGTDLLLVGAAADPAVAAVPRAADLLPHAPPEKRRHYLGRLGGVGSWAIELEETFEPPAGMAFVGLRGLYGLVPDVVWTLAGRAAQIVAWGRDHQYCGRCASPTERVPGERARRCPVCGLTAYPRLSPAVIVLIERGDEILLARGRRFPDGFYGIIAGFVEAGESLEEPVRREVAEEVGLALGEVRYFGSQPWPFSHAVMVGFTAAHAGGEIRVDERELAEAGWFGFGNLPRIPPKLSIARRLIDDWVARRGQTPIEQE